MGAGVTRSQLSSEPAPNRGGVLPKALSTEIQQNTYFVAKTTGVDTEEVSGWPTIKASGRVNSNFPGRDLCGVSGISLDFITMFGSFLPSLGR
jgi:hypothetical protein